MLQAFSASHVIIPSSRATFKHHFPSSNVHLFPVTNHRRLRSITTAVKSNSNNVSFGNGNGPVCDKWSEDRYVVFLGLGLVKEDEDG
ncbi:hypothetical protein Tco_1040650, partial [Tanacetum coccineum]